MYLIEFPSGGVASLKGLFSKEETTVRKTVMEWKSILIPLVIVGGWLVIYGIVLPALGVNT